jgi:hypothetical protein
LLHSCQGIELAAQRQAIAFDTKLKRNPSEYSDLRFVSYARGGSKGGFGRRW